MFLGNDELNRYTKQIKVQEIGIHGQLQLKNARVLCIGAGGLGSPLLLYLAAMGIGKLGIVDHDKLELSNLPRQILYQTNHLGIEKVTAAQQQLEALNPHVECITYPVKLTQANAASIVSDYDIVADCSDNFVTRYLVSDTCKSLQKPLVAAAIHHFSGQCMTFAVDGPCLRCVFPDEPSANCIEDCSTAGVLGLLPAWFGIMQAMEIVKIILQIGKKQTGTMITFDMLNYTFRELVLKRDPDCITCAKSSTTNSKAIKKINNDYAISWSELRTLLQKKNILLLDVRTHAEHAAFNIGGTHAPLNELQQQLPNIPRDSLIVCYCHSGTRSQLAAHTLLNAGFTNVKSLSGGIADIKNAYILRSASN